MRRLAQIIVAAMAMGLMVLRQPWNLRECPAGTCSYYSDETLLWTIFGAAIYVGFIAVIMTVVLVGVLGIRDSGRASDAAVLAALGQSQRSAVREAAMRGLKDGALVTGAAYVAATALSVWIVVSSGYNLGDLNPFDFVAWLVFAIGFTGMLVLAHVIDAVRPRRTPVERLYEDAAAPRPRRVSLATRAVALGAIAAAATGILVGAAVTHDNANGDAGTISTIAAEAAVLGLTFTGVALFFAVAVPLLRMAMSPALGGSASLAGAARATHAAAVLHTRAATASAGSARTVLAIAGLALLAGSVAVADPAPRFAPNYVGVVNATPAGIGDELANQIAELPGVGAVVVGTATDPGPNVPAVGIDPADLAGVDEQLAAMLSAHPGAAVASSVWGDVSLDNYAEAGMAVTGIVPTSTCCVQVVDKTLVPVRAGSSSVLIWAKPGADPVAVARTVAAFSPTIANLQGDGNSLVQGGSTNDVGGAVFLIVVLLLVCGGPIVALAYGVVQRRRREDATLAALGASRRSLAGAAVVETTVVAAVAVAGGLLSGALLRMGITGASRARDSLKGVITDSYVQTMWGSVAWATIGWMFVIAVAAFAVVAVVVKALARGALPAEQLRAAEEGVLS